MAATYKEQFVGILNSADATTATAVPLYRCGTAGEAITVGAQDQVVIHSAHVCGTTNSLHLLMSSDGTGTDDYRTIARGLNARRQVRGIFRRGLPFPRGYKPYLLCGAAAAVDVLIQGTILRRQS